MRNCINNTYNVKDSYSKKFVQKLVMLNSYSLQKIDIDKIISAINFAKECHLGQNRLSGEPYYVHPIEVATIVSNYSFDTNSIIAAILHDTIEDTALFLSQIKVIFGEEVAFIVEQLSRIDETCSVKIKLSKEDGDLKIANFEKQVLIIKLADRLHNMRTISIMPFDKKQKISKETIKVFVPLARHLGMESIASELMSLSLSALNP